MHLGYFATIFAKNWEVMVTLASSLLFWLVAGVLVIQFEPNYTSALVSMVILISLSIIVCFSLKAAPGEE